MELYERLIKEATGDAGAMECGEALEGFHQIPSTGRPLSEGLRERLIACAELGRWEEGREIAAFLATTATMPDEIREAVGRFHLRDAVSHAEAFDRKTARLAFGRMCVVWPEGRLEALESQTLAGIWC